MVNGVSPLGLRRKKSHFLRVKSPFLYIRRCCFNPIFSVNLFLFKSKVPLAEFLFAHFLLTCINTTVFIIQLAKFQHLVAEIIIVTLLFC
jgi:hypothetical protein